MSAGAAPPRSVYDAAPTLADAVALINAGQYKQAADLLKRRSVANPAPDPDADYLLGVAAFRSSDLGTAAGAFRRCVAADPGNGPAHYGLAKTLQAQGDHEGARMAFASAERAAPGITDRTEPGAKDGNAAGMPTGGPSPRPGFPPLARQAEADSPAESMADILDRSSPEPPGPYAVAGEIIWRGRPAVRSLIVPAVAPFLLLVVLLGIRRDAAGALPAGASRDATAVFVILVTLLVAASVVNWLMREFVIRERRIEIWTGLLGHRHVMLWMHDLERPLMVKQNLWQLALNLGTLEINSTILPTSSRRRLANRIGHLRFPGLPIREAEQVAEVIWSRSLWERRRLVKNFVSNR
jgi:tetratricopeptide (TPR) repeat protein